MSRTLYRRESGESKRLNGSSVIPYALELILKEESSKHSHSNESLERIIKQLTLIAEDIKTIKQPEELLSIEHVCEIIKFSHDWVYRQIREGGFPKPIKINTSSRWYRSEIDAWLDKQKIKNSDVVRTHN